MNRGILGSFSEFEKVLPKNFKPGSDPEKLEAVKHYFYIGGVLSIAPKSNGDWPSLIYPQRDHIKRKLESFEPLLAQYQERLKAWKDKYNEAKHYHTFHNIKKLKEPLYWQHMFKRATDSDYRIDSEKVKLPAHLVSDPKWRPMIKMFVSNIEYRKQLAETVETSIVYSKNKRVARYADTLQAFRMEESKRKIDELEKKIAEIEKTVKTLNVLHKWATA